MRIKLITTITMLMVLNGSAFGSEPSDENSPKMIAAIKHNCGELRYYVQTEALRKHEEMSVRDIISFLYDGANSLFDYSGAPTPVPNESTRKFMAANQYAVNYTKNSLKYKYVSNPSTEQIEKGLEKLYNLDPPSWNIHEGPTAFRISEILNDSVFAERLGKRAAELIKNRLSGKLGQRPEILNELSTRFKVNEVRDIWSNENCHILDGFGPD